MKREKWRFGSMALLGLFSLFGCAGRASTGADEGSSTGGDDGSDGTGGVLVPIEMEPNPFVPNDPDVSVLGDGRLQEGGSMEGSFGDGWDACFLPNYGMTIEENDAADGTVALSFRSASPAQELEQWSVGEAIFWGDGDFEASQPLSLYFEAKNLATDATAGELGFGFDSGGCDPAGDSVMVAISDLELGDEWETRCVELMPAQDSTYLVLWAQGENFAVGVDALRFGPPCH